MTNKIKRFNSADVIIILAVVAVFCGIFFRNSFEKLVDSLFYKADITYTLEIAGMNYPELSKNVELYDSDGAGIGVIVKKEISQEHTKTVLTVSTVGKHDNKGNYIGNSTFIAPGKQLDICLKNNKVFSALVKKVEYLS